MAAIAVLRETAGRETAHRETVCKEIACRGTVHRAAALGADGLSYRLPEIPYLRLRVELSARAPARLPAFKGSTLRGAFGHALKAAVCVQGRGAACAGCPVASACAYPRLFEGRVEGPPPPFSKGRRDAPRPFVFQPRCRTERFGIGDLLELDLLLLGQAVELQSFAVSALHKMAARGLGEGRRPFRLERIRVPTAEGLWRDAYHHGHQRWQGALPALTTASHGPLPERLRLRFVSPTRVVKKRRTLTDPPFRELVLRMIRRQLDLAHFHVPGARVDWTFNPLLRHADEITVESSRLRPATLRRYSHRQRRHHQIRGFVGELTLAGPLAPFTRLLRNAEITHVGKNAAFGLGQVEVVA